MSTENPMTKQHGGNHYKRFKIQPLELYDVFRLGFVEGNIIKYAMRWSYKNGAEDLQKAIHYLQILAHKGHFVGNPFNTSYIEYFYHENQLPEFDRQVIDSLSMLSYRFDHAVIKDTIAIIENKLTELVYAQQ